MKSQQIEAIAEYLKVRDEALGTPEADDAERLQSATDIAALSVPAAAVVGEPVAWIAQSRWEQMTAAEPWLTNVVYSEDQSVSFPCVPLYAAPSAPEGWRPIETAPKDGTCILVWRTHSNRPLMVKWDSQCDAFEDEAHGHHVYHLTHWRPLPAPPALGGASHE